MVMEEAKAETSAEAMEWKWQPLWRAVVEAAWTRLQQSRVVKGFRVEDVAWKQLPRRQWELCSVGSRGGSGDGGDGSRSRDGGRGVGGA